ncbi:MAG: rhamnulokinase [Treponema sp.]|jgi:rhamnulokinase|nr:rhamnulokinase [Treponema sp.]
MSNYYLAIDLGASGGRHILGHTEDGKLILEEVHRFSNAPLRQGGALVWDDERIFGEIAAGIAKCGALGRIPHSVAIDTWGVDYALIDKKGEPVKPVYSYRDSRTAPFLNTRPSFEELYAVTGTAAQPFNTVYQLLADKAAGRLEGAEDMLFLPEYFSLRLTGNLGGKLFSEYTIASTTGLLDARRRSWAEGIIGDLGLPQRLFKPVKIPPYEAGMLGDALRRQAGFDTRVVMVGSHDTASAVGTVESDALYISSGTWSLLGIQGEPILSAEARDAGYTNEGTLTGKIRFLKNIMGLWILQQIRHELGDAHSFAQLEEEARKAGEKAGGAQTDWFIDVNLPQFMNPPSMIEAVKAEYSRNGQRVPETPGELAFCVYSSLAQCYRQAIRDLEGLTGKTYAAISVIGGGSRDAYLNSLTAARTGKRVYAGPAEATAVGNLLTQMKLAGDPAVEQGFPPLVKRSFDVKECLF